MLQMLSVVVIVVVRQIFKPSTVFIVTGLNELNKTPGAH
jgi:hypothetical protein